MKKIFSALLLVGAVVVGILVGTSSASAVTTAPVCAVASATFHTTVSNRDDSAVGGTNWAKDNFVRTTVVTCIGTDTYKVNLIDDKGTFTPVANANSPQAGVPIHNLPFTGTFSGGTTFTVVSTDAPVDPKAGANGQFSSSEWTRLLVFPKADPSKIVQPTFRWVYTYCGESWINESPVNSGDITGKVCPAKPPTSTVTAPPTTVVQPVPGPTKVVTVTNPGQFAAVPDTAKGVNTGDGSLS
jgi:hypothetical protein